MSKAERITKALENSSDESICTKAAAELRSLSAERDSLRAVNADLLEALEAYEAWADKTICTDVDLKRIREQIRAAIASARKQGEQG